ncbi:MAG TPA: alanine racemase [Armatimonadota bacterium]|nr:alanine racemase [Armatimonadota bacterium]
MQHGHDAWVEVDLSAIKHNVEQVRSYIGHDIHLMAVVKADAYGHGAVETAKAMLDAGADALAVTRLNEAARLRSGGVTAPILVFDAIQPEAAEEAVALDVELTVCSQELAAALGNAARNANKQVSVHLKVDTGMGRLGVLPKDAPNLTRTIVSSGLTLTGTYTHFATAAEKDLTLAKEQLERFKEAIRLIEQAFLDPGIVHAANSAAILRLPESHFGMVRPGTILYGQYPSRYVPQSLDLKDTWKLKARISCLKTLPAGYNIGYGAEYTTRKEKRIAVIPLGWADGLTLMPESIARRSWLKMALAKAFHRPMLTVNIRRKKAKVVGRIAMQMCSVDVTRIPDVSVGDEVTIPARRVTTSPLLPRVYINKDSS